MASAAISVPGMSALDALNAASPAKLKAPAMEGKLRGAAQDFEAVFLHSMFQQMFTSVGGEGPLGGGGGGGVWRSFLTDAYAKNFARSGGIGLADEVYRTLLARQGAKI